MNQEYLVLSYYCFTLIENPREFRQTHHLYCIEKNLRGRIKIAPEGINGKVSGLKKDCEAYMEDLRADPRFSTTDFKIAPHTGYASEKLHVRLKREIVNAGMPHIKPYERTGTPLTPKEFEAMIQKEEVLILDVRSNYEHSVGRFKGSKTLNINSFREFPDHLPELLPYKNKPIVTVCTGRIKTDKASAYLLEQGFTDVYQLDGGILRYGKETDGCAFEGTCYVFDNRLTQPINTKAPTIISHCYGCDIPCERVVNCANPDCNLHIPLCEPCAEKYKGACSTTCQKAPKKRTYNGTGYYVKQTTGYDPYKEAKRDTKNFAWGE